MINFKRSNGLDEIPPPGASKKTLVAGVLCAPTMSHVYLGWPPYFMALLVRAGHIKPWAGRRKIRESGMPE